MVRADKTTPHASGVESIDVLVVYSPRAAEVDEVALTLPLGATLADALRRSGLCERHVGIDLATQRVGVWGALRQPGDVLRDGDRVEIYRPLQVDPKEARRLRHKQHLARYKA